MSSELFDRELHSRRRALLATETWDDFFRALPEYTARERAFRTVRVGQFYVSSLYLSVDSWDVWIAEFESPLDAIKQPATPFTGAIKRRWS